ncbi:MAG: hypothetical protein WC773_02385 [Patescibacteria group bacterium]
MPNSPTYTDIWNKIFPNRTAKPILAIASVVLVVILQYYFSKVHISSFQYTVIVVFAIYALWQSFWRQNIDALLLLFTYINFSMVYSFNHLEIWPIWTLLGASTVVMVILTIWRGHHLFPKSVLWRHSYLVGFITAQIITYLMYWVIYDDVLSEALLSTFFVYLLWSFLEADAKKEFSWNKLWGDAVMCLLLVVFVLATIKPVLLGSVR